MSIQSEIDRIKADIEAAFAKVAAKGGSIPSVKTSGNLSTAIGSIPAVDEGGPAAIFELRSIGELQSTSDATHFYAYIGGNDANLLTIQTPTKLLCIYNSHKLPQNEEITIWEEGSLYIKVKFKAIPSSSGIAVTRIDFMFSSEDLASNSSILYSWK